MVSPAMRHAGAAADVEDPAGVVAADGQLVRPWAVDRHAVGDRQVALVSVMVPCSPCANVDGVASPDCDARPQRVGAAVVQVGHREGAEQAPVLQSLPGAAGPSAAKGWVLI